MRRATITIPEDLNESIQAYMADQEVKFPLTALVQVALREFLDARRPTHSPNLPKDDATTTLGKK